MRRNLLIAILYTAASTLLLGIGYPLLVTVLAHVLFPEKANGSLVYSHNVLIGSRLIGQPFSGPRYFHSRPSSAGTGYDASASGGSNFGPTNQKLVDRISADVKSLSQEHPREPVPIDLVTTSASGLDPDITPAAASFQVSTVAHARGLSEAAVYAAVQRHTSERQFGFLGEPRVNVLALNRDLDHLSSSQK
jgi:K+-transporting ATPase ATPase C chain